MSKLSYQDSAFLRMESSRRPFHVAGLMLFKPPKDPPRGYMRRLVKLCGRLNEVWPMLNQRLSDPEDVRNAHWIDDDDYDPSRHVFHYALPPGGKMQDLLQLVTAAHERLLDRSRPLWELHVIEGLPGGRFALYSKIHHALVDGVGALQMIDAMFTTDATERFRPRSASQAVERHAHRSTLAGRMRGFVEEAVKQTSAVPDLLTLFAHMGRDALSGATGSMTLPFTAPHTPFNTDVDSRRSIAVCDISMSQVQAVRREVGGTVNDVLLAVCGGALREYLVDHQSLPRKSLVAGLPVSLKHAGEAGGNQLSFILSPFHTQERNALRRLRRVIKSTSAAKAELAQMTPVATRDFANLLLMPAILLTLTGNANRVNPALNCIFSNVPGSRRKLYMEGAELQAMYPLSVVTDSMGINITVVSYGNRLCFAVTSCPTNQPGIEDMGRRLTDSFNELRAAVLDT